MKTTFMKKLSAVSIAFLMLFSLTVPAFANENEGVSLDKEEYTKLKSEAENSNQAESKEATQKENNDSNQEVDDESTQEENAEAGLEQNDVSAQEENDESTQEGNEATTQEQNGDSTQEENNDSTQEEKEATTQEQNHDPTPDGKDESNQSAKDGSSQDENANAAQEEKENDMEDMASIEGPKENVNKSTEIHLHLKNCPEDVEKVAVELKGVWKEMSNPGNSPLYKLKDGGEFVEDDITAFRLTFESGTEQIYSMDEVRVGKEAEGSINYWLESCSIDEEDISEEPGDGTVNPGVGTEEPGDDNGEENGNKSTEIHLHLKNCVAPVKSVFVKLNGEWEEMSNPGNSPLYKLKDDGEFAKDDITEFKLVFESGVERVYKIEDLRVGVEAEGSINYWIEDCTVPEDNNTEEPGNGTGDSDEDSDQDGESPDVTEIVKELYINLNLDIKTVVKLTLVIKGGEKIELTRINNLWKLIFANGLDVTNIKGIELEFEDGTTKFITLSMLSFELKDQVLHLKIDEAVLGADDKTDVGNETDVDKDDETGITGNNDNNSGGYDKQNWSGKVLPKTGESSNMMFYIVGFLLMAAGTGLRMRKPISN
ncbi:LPXTG cell wall anchor domain-containing protein [Bacillus sp. ISL-35]|uniref:LPXTG cell wall anchor domain-containing protein n=1 Tax=Bacillus sp. ISL-35 TaxID=2819122 RepID=UPI001BE50D1B|nr:LPXTG cell wall anchor domain-containing protein [Bacillus sp. ISL-35]MBT2679104.1 LPXTG cell wall anchor domain-containing protein [Bacillus sp. ISL-35]MBT2702813.1 LPXTG cell wall anchor domain-containing protein [Chryseobacterium sp. ISL-80]